MEVVDQQTDEYVQRLEDNMHVIAETEKTQMETLKRQIEAQRKIQGKMDSLTAGLEANNAHLTAIIATQNRLKAASYLICGATVVCIILILFRKQFGLGGS